MIRFRNSSLEKKVDDVDLEIRDRETLRAAVDRVLERVKLGDRKPEEVFHVIVNGNEIHAEFWDHTLLMHKDSVLIFPILKSGDSGQIFKQVAFVAVIVAAAYFTGGLGLSAGATAALNAGIAIGASLALNALIPPPVPDNGIGGIGGSGDLSTSQMYAIGGQSNQTRKFNTVPKVYGTHRMFPTVAANPYTELEADPDTGQLVQYLYAVYDFGLGPNMVDKLQIGDTPISEFSDVVWSFVDFNRPATSEGEWDNRLFTDLRYYKGDHEINGVAVGLNYNQVDGGALDGYQAIRNAAVNTDGSKQEITLSFINPIGLYGYSATGELGDRSIVLNIYFALVGTEDWHAFNDISFVDGFGTAGGANEYAPLNLELYPADPYATSGNVYTGLGGYWMFADRSAGRTSLTTVYGFPNEERYKRRPIIIRAFGRNGQNGGPLPSFVVKNVVGPGGAGLMVGGPITYQGRFLGLISSIAVYGPDTNYRTVTLDRYILDDIILFSYEGYLEGEYINPVPPHNLLPLDDIWFGTDTAVTGKIYSHISTIGKCKISRRETGPVYSTFKFIPKVVGSYKVRVIRESVGGTFSYRAEDDLTWSSISTRFDRLPIITEKRHTFLEIRIRATNQLNGAIANLSGVVTSVLDVYDGDTETWSLQPTNNPAWIFTDLLIGQTNKRAIAKSRLHLESLVEWAEFCDEVPTPPPGMDFFFGRFECNFILDFQSTLQSALGQIASAAQASLNIVDGKYGVLLDKNRTTPVQIFTPRNSRGFASSRNYTTKPSGISIKFVDPLVDWGVSEVVAYDNGFDSSNAVEVQEMTSFGCTNDEQAWRFGRYMIAQNRYRQETISIEVDFEHLVCTRGDFVQITQDVMRVGGTPARVKAVSGTEITIDDGLEIDGGEDYGYVFRAADGQIKQGTLTPLFADVFDLDDDIPAIGDLVVIGIVGTEVFDCIVKSISPNDDLSATIVLVEKGDEIYDYESTTDFNFYDPQLAPASDGLAAPGEVEDLVVADNWYDCDGASKYAYFIDLDWDAPSGSTYETFQIFANYGRGYVQIGSTRESMFRYTVDQTYLGVEHSFKVLAVSATGLKLDLGAVATVVATPMSKSTPPSDIEALSMDITGEVLQLLWPQISDCDCKEYLIRYSPVTLNASWLSSIPLLRVDRNTTLAATQARTGTYLIKAIDFNGNESAVAAQAITTVPSLFNLNVIEEITDAPDFNGSLDKVVVTAESVILQQSIPGGPSVGEYYTEGFYYYESLLDLGEIYTVRLTSQIQAEGYTLGDFMYTWDTLADVLALASAGYADWDVETQYRSTESFNVIADWDTLDEVETMTAGDEDEFTPWRKFIAGDATGRIFQFRLRLLSYKADVSPRVFDANIRADMPDRLESFDNLAANNTTGYIVTYSPSFKGPNTTPNVQISLEDAESGDYWSFTSKTLDGFQIKFYDKTDTQVARTFDAVAKGFGRKATAAI